MFLSVLAVRALWWETGGNLLSGAFTQVVVVGMIMLTASFAVAGTMEPLPAIATIGMCLRFTTMLDDVGAAVFGVEERRQMMNHLDAVMDAEVMDEPASRAQKKVRKFLNHLSNLPVRRPDTPSR